MNDYYPNNHRLEKFDTVDAWSINPITTVMTQCGTGAILESAVSLCANTLAAIILFTLY